MKTKFFKPFQKMLLLVIVVITISCQDEDEKPKSITCMPVALPAIESMINITYNDQQQMAIVTYDEFDSPAPNVYKTKYTYLNGKVSTVEETNDNVKMAYHTFEYTTNRIIDSYFFRAKSTDDFEKILRTVFYLENNRVVKSAWKDIKYDDYDSVAYTYDAKGNIVHVDQFNKNKVKESTTDFEFDDKVSPYNKAGINGDDDAFFGVQNLSVNNITKFTYKEVLTDYTEIEVTTYTYDADGKVLTRKFDWEAQAHPFTYECK
jgi:hypothetical protein